MTIPIRMCKVVTTNDNVRPTAAIITYAISYLQPFINHLYDRKSGQ